MEPREYAIHYNRSDGQPVTHIYEHRSSTPLATGDVLDETHGWQHEPVEITQLYRHPDATRPGSARARMSMKT